MGNLENNVLYERSYADGGDGAALINITLGTPIPKHSGLQFTGSCRDLIQRKSINSYHEADAESCGYIGKKEKKLVHGSGVGHESLVMPSCWSYVYTNKCLCYGGVMIIGMVQNFVSHYMLLVTIVMQC